MNMHDRQIVLYLGYHKTASKWVWNNYFKRYYSCHQINAYRRTPEEINEILAAEDGNSPVILRSRIEDGLMAAVSPEFAETLAGNFPNARVVTCIRSQRSMLPSHYTQYVRNGGRLTFSAYLDEVVKSKWHYTPVLDVFRRKFGDRFFVYLFEDFRKDPFSVLKHLRDFIGAPEGGLPDEELRKLATLPPMNPQRNDLVIDTMLMLNRLRLRHRKNAIVPEIRRPGRDHIVAELASATASLYQKAFGKALRYRTYDDAGILEKFYGEENAALAEIVNRPLHELGYPYLGR